MENTFPMWQRNQTIEKIHMNKWNKWMEGIRCAQPAKEDQEGWFDERKKNPKLIKLWLKKIAHAIYRLYPIVRSAG